MKHIEVVCAVIRDIEGNIFCCKRGPGRALEGYWEFPGGKVETNETHEQTIVREIREELKSEVEPMRYIGLSSYEYNNIDSPFSITMYAYECKLLKGDLILTEHTAKRWINIMKLKIEEFAPADRPIIEMLKD